MLGLGAGRHHRHHDAEGADIQRAGDEVIFAARHARHRDDIKTPAKRELRLERLEAQAGVLHVVHDELRAGITADLRQAGHEAFEHHRADCAAAACEHVLDRVVAHACLSSLVIGRGDARTERAVAAAGPASLHEQRLARESRQRLVQRRRGVGGRVSWKYLRRDRVPLE
jgi:hypothetical protein